MIAIHKGGNGNTYFRVDGRGAGDNAPGYQCASCGSPLLRIYVYLMNELKKAGLIDEDHIYLCCVCFPHVTKIMCERD